MENFSIKTLSSLVKVFADEEPAALPHTEGSALKNEVYSYQVAYCFRDSLSEAVTVRVSSPAAQAVTVREVGLVPSELPVHVGNDDYVLRRMPGMFPDPLRPLPETLPNLPGQWRSLWVTVEPAGRLPAGRYPIELRFEGAKTGLYGASTFTLEILDAELPEQRLLCTQWFHTDGIIHYYGVPVFSERYWTLTERFMESAAAHGINTILTPVLTPPLDTREGGERETVQLAEIEKDGDRYAFRFDRLRRWIGACRRAGIRNLEINHMFTQWGARHAPKVMARDLSDGVEKRIFGWETDAAGPEYWNFLEQLIPALLSVLREQGMDRNTFFHVSDEPAAEHLEQYARVASHFKELVRGYPVIDALSDYRFYQAGVIEHPIPGVNHIMPFIEGGVPDLWTYYCVSQCREVTNRFFGMPSERCRVLGVQMYKYNIRGFLHWGFNFYNTRLSIRPIDPFAVTDADRSFPSGDAFVVYPGPDGPWSSLRLEVFYDALQDQRALELAERLAGREAVLALIEEGLPAPLTFEEYPHDAEWLLSLRGRVNALIAAHI